MSWYTTGAEAADALAAASAAQSKRSRNFWTVQGLPNKEAESATIRFLSPATVSFNYKRAFVKWAKGATKYFTSPQTDPDPFIEAGLTLQASFAWWIIDRRLIEFKDSQTGETKKIGPRILYFADGQRTRKQLLAFEKQQLKNENEEREQDGKDALTLEEFNLTSYDITCSKDKGAPWLFTAKRPRPLAKSDLELVEKAGLVLERSKLQEAMAQELAPLSGAELRHLLRSAEDPDTGAEASVAEETTPYSYETADEEDDTIKFDD